MSLHQRQGNSGNVEVTAAGFGAVLAIKGRGITGGRISEPDVILQGSDTRTKQDVPQYIDTPEKYHGDDKTCNKMLVSKVELQYLK